MSVYESVWGFRTATDNLLFRTSACYAEMTREYGEFKKRLTDGAKSAISVVRINLTSIKIPMCNWYLHRYVIPSMPDRMKEGTTITRVFSKGMRKLNPDLHFGKEKLPWIKIECDANKINVHDMFLLFLLARTPAEFPTCIKLMWSFAGEMGLPMDVAFFLASLECGGNSNHAVLQPHGIRDREVTGETILTWSLKDRWEKLAKHKLCQPWVTLRENNIKKIDIADAWLLTELPKAKETVQGMNRWADIPKEGKYSAQTNSVLKDLGV